MCAGLPPLPASTENDPHTPRRSSGSREAIRSAAASLRIEPIDMRAFRVGLDVAKRRLESSANSQHQTTIERALERDRARLKAVLADLSGANAFNGVLEAERLRREQLSALVDPTRGLLDDLKARTKELQSLVDSQSEGLRRMAELGSSGVQQLAAELSIGKLSELYSPLRIHAAPLAPARADEPQSHGSATRAPEQKVLQHSARSSLLIPAPAKQENPCAIPNQNLDSAGTQQLLNHLSRFLESEEIPCDARVGLSGTIAWWKLNQGSLNPEHGRKLNTLLLAFLQQQLGLEASPAHHDLLSSGLLVPSSSERDVPEVVPDLDPKIYGSKELAEILRYHEANIRRLAAAAWKKGPGPQPLKKDSEWYVVAAPDSSEGGRGCGWKFQRLRKGDAD